MSLPRFGAEVSIHESLKHFASSTLSGSDTRPQMGRLSAASLATTGLRRPQLSLIDPQRKLLTKYFRDSAQFLGLLLLFLLLLCSMGVVVFSVGSAINLVSNPTLPTNLSQHSIP